MKTEQKFNVLICGCGNIGFRHLQGIIKSKLNLNIFLYDINHKASKTMFDNIKKEKFNKKSKSVSILTNIKDYIYYDIILISSTSKDRFIFIKKLLKKVNCNHMIIEKIAFLNPNDYQLAINLIKEKKIKAWINTNHHYHSYTKFIKSKIRSFKNSMLIVNGSNFNLISNIIHYMMFVYNLNKKLKIKNLKYKLSNPFMSKRIGYYEMTGFVEILYNYNFRLIINNFNSSHYFVFKNFITKDFSITIDESNGEIYHRNNKNKIISQDFDIKHMYQSNLTTELINNLLLKNKTILPNIVECQNAHRKIYEMLTGKIGKKNINKFNFT